MTDSETSEGHRPNCDGTALQVCSRCIYDSNVSSIEFDEQGVCNLCHQVDRLRTDYGVGEDKGRQTLQTILDRIKSDGRGKRYDCIIGVSGGTDSSYMLHLANEWGLRPLAVHYDNTWNTAISTQNIRKLLQPLNIDLYTHVIDNKESDDIFRAFFLAGVPELDAATDLGLSEVMYRAAWRHGVKYVLEGHSFITEGITPVGKNYFDGEYISSIHRQFGRLPMKTYPLMTFSRFLWWTVAAKIQKIRPFWYIPYSKEDARTLLEERYGWQYYGGHHLENRITAYAHSAYLPVKFNTDYRNNTLSARVRNGQMDRAEALREYSVAPVIDADLVSYFKKRLGLETAEYLRVMAEAPRSWTDFPTYKKRFERLRPLFAILAKRNLVPMSFYLKYCFPVKTT